MLHSLKKIVTKMFNILINIQNEKKNLASFVVFSVLILFCFEVHSVHDVRNSAQKLSQFLIGSSTDLKNGDFEIQTDDPLLLLLFWHAVFNLFLNLISPPRNFFFIALAFFE